KSVVGLVNNWYWARGEIGDYTLIASFITTEKRYGYKIFPLFMLAYQGRIIADDGRKVRFSAGDIQTDQETRRPVADVTIYDYRDGDRRYVLTFKRERTILRIKLVETIKGNQAFLARL